jgi:hypothetical protein
MQFGPKAKVAVIGAGCSGITALKNLLQAGLREVVCYEQQSDVGGNWIYTTEPSHSSVCETTHIISSKRMSEYPDFPMPEDYPDYPSHDQVLAYFRAYAQHFGLYPYIRFNTRVERIEKQPDERWRISLDDGSQAEYDFLLIANGHHSVPHHPAGIREQFSGRYLHSHAYKHNRSFAGERVLVIGGGNSACDCAVEISRVAERVDISIRSPQYIIPKFFLGRPTDTFNKGMQWLPEFLAAGLRKLALRIQIGRYRDYGLAEPTEPVTRNHPTLNSELLYKIRHGKVHPRRGIARITDREVEFVTGERATYDTIVAATGYHIALPFFDPEFLNFAAADRIPLWLRMFHPDHPSLLFIGLLQPQGAIWPLSDAQAQLAANYIAGNYQLPDDLAARAEADSDHISREFSASKRHRIEVHFHPFLQRVRREIPATAPAWREAAAPVA